MAATLNSAVTWNVRPGINKLHTFRSNVLTMRKHKDGKRLMVLLVSGKAYVSNKKLTRWRLMRPLSNTTKT